MITLDANQVKEALALLLTQFKGLPGIEGLITSYVNQIQILENVFNDLATKRGLRPTVTAVGAQLDQLGKIVLQNRGGLADLEYSQALIRKGKINASYGTTPEIIDILSSFDDYGFNYIFSESPNASFDFEAVDPILFGPDLLLAALAAKSAGVKVGIAWPSDGLHFFSVGPAADPEGESNGLDGIGGFITGGSDEYLPPYPVPVIETIANIAATHGVAGSHDFKTSDVSWPFDFSLLAFVLTGALPAGFSFNTTTGVLSWTNAIVAGTSAGHTLTAQYSRSSLQTSNTFSIVVS